MIQIARYYVNRPSAPPQQANTTLSAVDAPALSKFDKLRERLLTDDAEEGWALELRRYLGTMQRDVTKDTDLVKWWQVSCLLSLYY